VSESNPEANMNLGLQGKVALVTGGNSGIGRAIAAGFANEGAKVVIAARNSAKGLEAVDVIKKGGGECQFVQTDVSSSGSVSALIQGILKTYGRLDCAVNNAGIEETQKGFLDWTEDEWERTMAVNLKGVWMCMKNEIPPMLKQASGAIVNISSVAGLIGFPMLGPYVASKHGVLGLTKSASVEFAQNGVRVNSVCPGTIVTPMQEQAFANQPELAKKVLSLTPMGRGGQVEECVGAVLWLCSSSATFTSGITVSVDGGWSQH
jgi:NAD(P)-dependent dehydrogenase (short-subunit alcohol dehydrogenase family)